ncbi:MULTISPECIES: DNA-binding transcriptional repressor DeoR [Pseudomonas]|uniref:Regulatory protein, DeoR n=3 Tax=Pseudomonas syringae group genomosp. 2 TaxID=251698 RepID=A0AAX1W157_PSEAJ|nr:MULTISPECIES: DNA-binding transcriptional repressor DeoR [Pseudomonas syringae group genomosp. 2]KPX58800.1 Regulatory protein, DeoR [Pseudomonas amygdali pv. lachrymans]KEZ26916.1 DeoR faimly transcriptional regulator [Pseudomonas amygdali pv. tabaci str. 6605]KIY17552.1 DeoR faimly transcriptional regulator [Pseudomonas amygdali pv. tabaci]KPY77455.1 Regulatory protein, DeoR [Pseudomonas amygdali pv. tabaci]RML83145.1 Regulatory protein, DeoR [Pseudomonas amygdali pv. tabaci]
MPVDVKKTDRIKQIQQALQDQKAIHLREMAALLEVSEMTLRRDLSRHPGQLRLLGGYITRAHDDPEPGDYRVSEQDTRHVEEKRRIGKLAAAFISPGDTVFFDCGTTIPFVVDFIPDELEFTAVCNSLNVLLKLQQKPNCSIVLCGGVFHRKNQVFESHAETSILGGVRLTWAFVSAAGVSLDCGVTCFNFHEVEVKQKVMRQARQSLLLADHSKFDAVRTAHFGALSDFHCVVSDKKIPRSYREAIEAGGAQLVI